ncbi:MAG: hypothetical protein ACYTG4_16060 [Planctomycetota bacterium]
MSESLEDPVRAKCLACEKAFKTAFEEAAGADAARRLSVRVTPRASVLLGLDAAVKSPQGDTRTFKADLPLVDALQFARGFGSHLGSSLKG